VRVASRRQQPSYHVTPAMQPPLFTLCPVTVAVLTIHFSYAAGFATVGAKTSEGEKAWQAMLYGCGLLTISVMADSLVPNAQQQIMKSVRSPSQSCMVHPSSRAAANTSSVADLGSTCHMHELVGM
jgi:hypothetical protein